MPVIFFLFCSAAQAKKTITLGHTDSPDSPVGKGALLFKHLIEERLGDQVEIRIYPNSSLGNSRDLINGVRLGSVEGAIIPIGALKKLSPALKIFDLPFIFNDLGHVARFQKTESMQRLLQGMEKQNIKALSFWPYRYGSIRLHSKN